jgi:hypothetical protein
MDEKERDDLIKGGIPCQAWPGCQDMADKFEKDRDTAWCNNHHPENTTDLQIGPFTVSIKNQDLYDKLIGAAAYVASHDPTDKY